MWENEEREGERDFLSSQRYVAMRPGKKKAWGYMYTSLRIHYMEMKKNLDVSFQMHKFIYNFRLLSSFHPVTQVRCFA